MAERAQHAVDKVLDELWRRVPAPSRRHPYVAGMTGRGIFGPRTSLVFSWQSRSEASGIGIIWTHRCQAGAPDFSVWARRIRVTGVDRPLATL